MTAFQLALQKADVLRKGENVLIRVANEMEVDGREAVDQDPGVEVLLM